MNEKIYSANIVIDNLTDAQRIAIEDMMSQWVRLGKMGSSRWTAFFADGDGNFQPNIRIDGKEPEPTDYIKEEDKWKQLQIRKERDMNNGLTMTMWLALDDVYMMDFDGIAWPLHAEKRNDE